MRTTSQAFQDAIKADREVVCQVTILGTSYGGDSIKYMEYSHGVTNERFEVGRALSAYLKVTIRGLPKQRYDGVELIAKIGVNIGSSYEYVQLGKFYVDEIERTKNTTTLHAMDAMVFFDVPYSSDLTYPATAAQVATEIRGTLPLTGSISSYASNTRIIKKPSKQSERDVLAAIAGLHGADAVIPSSGDSIVFRSPEKFPERNSKVTIDGSQYFTLTRENESYSISSIEASDGTNTFLGTNASFQNLSALGYNFSELSAKGSTFGSIGRKLSTLFYYLANNTFANLTKSKYRFENITDFNSTFANLENKLYMNAFYKRQTLTDLYTLRLESKFVTEDVANGLIDKLSGTPLLAFDLDYRGNPALEVGDCIQIVEFIDESTTETFYASIGSVKLVYSGGLRGKLSAVSESSQSNTNSSSTGTMTTDVNSLKSDMSSVIRTTNDIDSAVDLATIKQSGIYYCAKPDSTPGMKYYGRPNGTTTIVLEVIANNIGTNGVQIAYERHDSDAATTYAYKRNWYQSATGAETWTSWRRTSYTSYTIPTI